MTAADEIYARGRGISRPLVVWHLADTCRGCYLPIESVEAVDTLRRHARLAMPAGHDIVGDFKETASGTRNDRVECKKVWLISASAVRASQAV
jgi:hypothetical protein